MTASSRRRKQELARGEGSTDNERNAGLIIGVILGTFALAALLVVVYVSDPGPANAPLTTSIRIETSNLAPLFCQNPPPITMEEQRAEIDRALRERGYVAANEWVDDQPIGAFNADAIQGGCGIVLAHAREGSDIGGVRIDGAEMRGCQRNMMAVATCGEDVEFTGVGVASVRAYVMPGVSDAPVGLSVSHRLLHAEAEHLLARRRFEAGPRVFISNLDPHDSFTLDAPETGCSHYVISALGRGILVAEAIQTSLSDVTVSSRTICEGEAPAHIESGTAPGTFAIRRYTETPGVGVPMAIAAQISDAEIVADFDDL